MKQQRVSNLRLSAFICGEGICSFALLLLNKRCAIQRLRFFRGPITPRGCAPVPAFTKELHRPHGELSAAFRAAGVIQPELAQFIRDFRESFARRGTPSVCSAASKAFMASFGRVHLGEARPRSTHFQCATSIVLSPIVLSKFYPRRYLLFSSLLFCHAFAINSLAGGTLGDGKMLICHTFATTFAIGFAIGFAIFAHRRPLTNERRFHAFLPLIFCGSARRQTWCGQRTLPSGFHC